MGSCRFHWWGFHLCAFSKHSPNIQLMQFSLHKWRNSFTLAFLVTNDLGAADLDHADFWQTYKKRMSQGPAVLHTINSIVKHIPEVYMTKWPHRHLYQKTTLVKVKTSCFCSIVWKFTTSSSTKHKVADKLKMQAALWLAEINEELMRMKVFLSPFTRFLPNVGASQVSWLGGCSKISLALT